MVSLVYWTASQVSKVLRKALDAFNKATFPAEIPDCLCADGGLSDQCRFVSPPARAGKAGQYTCIVEYQNKPYSIFWSGSSQFPDVAQFPTEVEYQFKEYNLGSKMMSDVWSNSKLVDFGADAVVRCSHIGLYPVIKLAHQGSECRLRIQHEYEMLKDMIATGKSLPIPMINDRPLLDHDHGIIGYRLERLTRLEEGELARRLPEVKQAVQRLHEAGFSHGDLSLSNVMKNKHGALVLIDFGCSGRVGTQASISVPVWVYTDGLVTTEADLQALDRL